MPRAEFTNFGKFVNEEVQKRSLSIREFAKMVGVSHTTVNGWINGSVKVDQQRIGNLVKLARFTGVDLCTLLSMLYPDVGDMDTLARTLAQIIVQLPPEKQKLLQETVMGIASLESINKLGKQQLEGGGEV